MGRWRRTIGWLAVLGLAATVSLLGTVPAFADASKYEDYCGTDYGGPANWTQASVPYYPVAMLNIRIQVGSDDIRSGTNVDAAVEFNRNDGAGDMWATTPGSLNNGAAYAPGSLLQGKIFLSQTILFGQIRAVEIYYLSGSIDPIDSDNWDMSRIRVQYPKQAGANPPPTTSVDTTDYNDLLFGVGSPWFHRFKVNCDSQSGEGGPTWTGGSPFYSTTLR